MENAIHTLHMSKAECEKNVNQLNINDLIMIQIIPFTNLPGTLKP